MSNLPNLVKIMYQYGHAIRHDWSDFDGRIERDTVQEWANMVAKGTDYESLVTARDQLGLCPDGEGHWGGRWGYCEHYECPTWVKENSGK